MTALAPPTTALIFEVGEATWPPASARRLGPWVIREGKGGGQRVSAATQADPERPAGAGDIAAAEAAMEALGQPKLFQIRPGEEALDAALEACGYEIVDPVTTWIIPTKDLAIPANRPAMGTTFATFPPLALMREIWAEGGIGAGRLAVMARGTSPKTALLTRLGDHPAGLAYLGIHKRVAMLHALHVVPAQRRHGAARALLHEAGFWAQAHGADWLTLYVTRANVSANALYASLGMREAGAYHYRKKS